MSASQRVPTPVSQAGPGHSELDDLRATRWRQEQEIDSLNETIVVYRQGASALADVIERPAPRTRRCALAAHPHVHPRHAVTRSRSRWPRDEDAPAVVAIAVGEALEPTLGHAVDAWRMVASDLTEEAVLRHGESNDVMLLLRLKHSQTAVAIEVLAA